MYKSKAALYLRVSTEEQVSNLSLDTQEAECRALCARQGLDVVEVFREEGASAKTLERPQIQRLLAYLGKAKGKVDQLVVCRIDRLSRNREDFFVLRAALRRHGVGLLSCREQIADASTIEAVIVETFSVLTAQIDNMIRSARTRTGMTEAARRGRWVWQAPPGYRHAPRLEDGRPAGLEIDPEQAPLVRRAFDMVAGGCSIDQTRRELLAAGLRSSTGKPIGRQTFHQLLRRRLYAGRLESTGFGVDAPSAAPAIVDEATFLRAQEAIAKRAPTRRCSASLEDFPLRGVARCPCGRKLVAYYARGKSGRRWPYYRCQRCGVSAPRPAMDAAFVSLLARLSVDERELALLDRMVSELYARRADELEERLARAKRQMTTAEGRLERLMAMRVDGEIGAEEFAAGRARAIEQRDAARLELSDLTAPLDQGAELATGWVRRLLVEPAVVWGELEPNQRPQFADGLFPEGITYHDGEMSNPSKCLLALPFEADPGPSSRVVRPAGTSSNPGLLVVQWRRSLTGFRDRVLRRAA